MNSAWLAAMRIGGLDLSHPFVLAPMEEHTELPLRLLMRRHGASAVWGERLDAAEVASGDKRARKLLATDPAERPALAQVSASAAGPAAEAARVVEGLGYAGVDLNAECPVRRVLGCGEGGALMGDLDRLQAIVAAMAAAVRIPVWVKLRSGPVDGQENAAEAVARCAAAGAAGVMVHARSVATGYAGAADWTVIARARTAAAIPVIASGGIRTAEDACACLRATGAAAVAIARGCLGEPWIFARARALHAGSPPPAPPTPEQRGRELLRLAEEEWRFFGPGLALRRLPRTACYFAKPFPWFAEFRSAVQQARDLAALKRLVQERFR